jgi:hypothetical protein
MTTDDSDDSDAPTAAPVKADSDHALVRWCAMLMLEGLTESEVKRRLIESSLMHSRPSPDRLRRLLRRATIELDSMTDVVLARAELHDTDWLRLDSYLRRRKVLDGLEAVFDAAVDGADTVSQMGQAAFIGQGVVKAQDSLDGFTGAKAAKPHVVVQVNYDPLEQMRAIIQSEVKVIRKTSETPLLGEPQVEVDGADDEPSDEAASAASEEE